MGVGVDHLVGIERDGAMAGEINQIAALELGPAPGSQSNAAPRLSDCVLLSRGQGIPARASATWTNPEQSMPPLSLPPQR